MTVDAPPRKPPESKPRTTSVADPRAATKAVARLRDGRINRFVAEGLSSARNVCAIEKMTKQVRLSDDAYRALAALKCPGESFSDAARRLLKCGNRERLFGNVRIGHPVVMCRE